MDSQTGKRTKVLKLFCCGVNAFRSNYHRTFLSFFKNIWTYFGVVLTSHSASLTETLSVHKLISRGITTFAAAINYSNAPKYLGAKLTRTNSNQTDGSLDCQLCNAGIGPLTGNDGASARSIKPRAEARRVPAAKQWELT